MIGALRNICHDTLGGKKIRDRKVDLKLHKTEVLLVLINLSICNIISMLFSGPSVYDCPIENCGISSTKDMGLNQFQSSLTKYWKMERQIIPYASF